MSRYDAMGSDRRQIKIFTGRFEQFLVRISAHNLPSDLNHKWNNNVQKTPFLIDSNFLFTYIWKETTKSLRNLFFINRNGVYSNRIQLAKNLISKEQVG